MWKTPYIKRSWLTRSYYKDALILIFLAGTIFLAMSLITYNPTDSSWVYTTTHGWHVSNYGGAVGAQCAAILHYLFGAASLLMVLFLVHLLSFFIKDTPLRSVIDQWGTYGILLVIGSAFCTLHGISLFGESVPGGLFGSVISMVFIKWFDLFGAYLFVYTLLAVCFVMITQFSFIAIAHGFLNGVVWLFKLRVWLQPIGVVCMRVASFVYALVLIGAGHAARIARSIGYFIGDKLHILSVPVVYEIPEYSDDLYELSRIAVENPDAPVSDTSASNVSVSLPEIAVAEKTALSIAPELTSIIEYKKEEALIPKAKSIVPRAPSVGVKASFHVPSISIFAAAKSDGSDAQQMKELDERARVLEEKLQCFGIAGSVTSIKSGPVVALFEYQPDIDSKISKIIALEDDLALALQALSIRIIAPIPGRAVVGFEVSNARRKNVLLATVIQSPEYLKQSGQLPLILGQDTVGNNVVVDLAKMPHLLVAGSTGSGKSVALNTMLVSLLCARTPDELKLILIDPKRLEFAPYADIAHLIFPIITAPKDASPALAWVVQEMEARYKLMAQRGARQCTDYNKMVGPEEHMPLIVVVIDELSDLMMTAGREIEGLIIRITQMARAAGIHLIVATQRPSVDVITGLIKVNFPSRISFRVTSKIDSRTILDCSGADKLLGRGDMLFLDSADSSLKRVHGAYVTDEEIQQVTDAIRAQRGVCYRVIEPQNNRSFGDNNAADDALYDEILTFLKEIDEISISLLQRKFRIGYNRSARIIETLESQGLVIATEGGKTRKVVR